MVKSARTIQEFLWSGMNQEAGLEEFKRMFRKRLSKIEKVKMDNPHWKIELKKMDQAITRTVENVVLLITMGNEPDKGGINPVNFQAMQSLFQKKLSKKIYLLLFI